MECNVAKQIMPDYLMGLTDETVKKELEEHLKECEACQKHLEELKKAELDYKKDGVEPLKKVNKVIKKHKRGKILAIIGIIILLGIVSVFVLGELKPEERKLPSITKMRYKHKAEKIVEQFFNNDMEALLNGCVSYLIPGTDDYPFTKAECVQNMILDYSDQLKKMNEGLLYNKDYRIDRCDVYYHDMFSSYLGRLYPSEEKYKNHNYEVCMEISTDIGNLRINIQFFNDDNYDFSFFLDNSDSKSVFENKLLDMNLMISHICRIASGADYYPYLLNGRLLNQDDENKFFGFSHMFATLNCHENSDDTYINGFSGRLEEIYKKSKTESVNMEIRNYDNDAHALNVEMIWVIKDLNGHEAVMRKNLLYGPYGYQKVDDEAKFVSENGFDTELEMMMRELF